MAKIQKKRLPFEDSLFSFYLISGKSLFNHSEFTETFRQLLNSIVYLLFGVSSHQCYAYQRILRCTSGRNNRIDEDAFVKRHLSYDKCLFRITHIQRNDRRFSFTDFETGITEFLQCIVGDVPQTLLTFRFVHNDVKSFTGSSRSSRRVTCLEYIRTGIVAQPVDYRSISGNETTDRSQ